MGYTAVILIDDQFVLIMGTVTMLTMAMVLILFAFLFQRKLIRKQILFREIEAMLQKQEVKATYEVLEAQETERKRIAQDLHDGIGSTIAAIKYHFSAIRASPQKEEELFTEAIKLLDDAA